LTGITNNPVAINAGKLYDELGHGGTYASGLVSEVDDYADRVEGAARGVQSSPSHGGLPVQGDLEAEMSIDIHAAHPGHPGHQESMQDQLFKAQQRYIQDQLRQSRANFDMQHPVDVYQSVLAGLPDTPSNLPNFTYMCKLQASWQIPERIHTITICLPTAAVTAANAVIVTNAIVRLGDRFFQALPNDTQPLCTYTLPVEGIILMEEGDERELHFTTAAGGGAVQTCPFYFGLTGFADEIWGNA
jgi:hypothetical protein